MTAQLEKKKEEFSQDHLIRINKAQKNLSEIVYNQVKQSENAQAQSALNKIQDIRLLNNGKLEANYTLKDGQTLTEEEKKAIGTFLIEGIKKLDGENKKIAFCAFRTQPTNSTDLDKYLNDTKFEAFINYKLSNATIVFGNESKTNEQSEGSGEISASTSAKLTLKWTNEEYEKWKRESIHVTLNNATEAQKEAIEKTSKSKSKVGVEEIEGQKYVVVVTGETVGTKTKTGAIFIPYNEEIQNKVTDKFNDNIDEFMKSQSKYVIDEKDSTQKSGFYMKGEEVWVSLIHSDGKRKQSLLKNKDGINKETLKDTFYVLHNFDEDIKFKEIRKKNGFTKKDSDKVRKAFTKDIKEIEGYTELVENAINTYQQNNKGFKINEEATILGYVTAIEEYKKRKENENKFMYKGMPGQKLGEGLSLKDDK